MKNHAVAYNCLLFAYKIRERTTDPPSARDKITDWVRIQCFCGDLLEVDQPGFKRPIRGLIRERA
jgi:hypothetical protein